MQVYLIFEVPDTETFFPMILRKPIPPLTRNLVLFCVTLLSGLTLPAQTAQFTSDSPRCQHDSLHFYPAPPGGTILSETWDFGDGTVTTFLPPVTFPVYPVHHYPIGGFYTVSRTVTFTGGPLSSTLNIWVNAPPIAAFMVMFTPTCEDQLIPFTDFSVSNGMGFINQWRWEWGDGTPPLIAVWPASLNFNHTFANAGTYPVILTVTDNNGCFDSVMHSVTIHPAPVPAIIGEDTLCPGTLGVVYQTEAGMSAYQWSVSPGGSIQSGAGTNAVTVNWPVAGSQWISAGYTSPQGCAAATATVLPVAINNPPDSLNQVTNVTVGTGQPFCGDAGLTLTLAGNGSTLVVSPGGDATFIAGREIRMLPGLHAFAGGHLDCRITSSCRYCPASKSPEAGMPAMTPDLSQDVSAGKIFRIYPNPTEGLLVLEAQGETKTGPCMADIYDIRGGIWKHFAFPAGARNEFSVADLPCGVYYCRIRTASGAETLKIVRK